MDLYWRIRSWELNVSMTFLFEIDDFSEEITVEPPSPYQLTYSFDDQELYPPLTSEEELVCGNKVSLINITRPSDDTTAPRAFIQMISPQKNGSLYSPGFNLFFEFYLDIFGFEEVLFVGGTSGQSDGQKSFSIYGSQPISLSFGTDSEYATFVDATFSLEPTEWWSYGGMYNTSTGARL